MVVMRIAVMGAGGVGGYFGAKLARAGHAVTMVARGAHLEAIRRHGLRIRSAAEGDWAAQVEAVDALGGRPPAEAVVLAVKGFDTEAALAQLRPVVGPGTPVLSLQNGVSSAESIDRVLGPGHAVGGAAYVFAFLEEPGVIAHRLLGRIVLGELDGQVTARVEALRAVLAGAGIPVELSTAMRRVLWEKYLLIGAQAGMTALTRSPSGVLRAIPECWSMYRALVEEMAALGRAEGVDLAPDAVDRIMAAAGDLAPQATSSMANDLEGGRRLELEALHGHAVRLGARHGIPTPATCAVYAALKPHVAGRRG
jgi:2-dehydropantoate 2-reductase